MLTRSVRQDDLSVVGGGGDADPRVVDRLDHVVDVLGVGEVDDGSGAAAVGNADFTGRETFPAVDLGEIDALVDGITVTESERSAAQRRGGTFETGA